MSAPLTVPVVALTSIVPTTVQTPDTVTVPVIVSVPVLRVEVGLTPRGIVVPFGIVRSSTPAMVITTRLNVVVGAVNVQVSMTVIVPPLAEKVGELVLVQSFPRFQFPLVAVMLPLELFITTASVFMVDDDPT